MQCSVYLTFPGTAQEAMTFYQSALGGDLKLMTFADAPPDAAQSSSSSSSSSKGKGKKGKTDDDWRATSEADMKRVMHASLSCNVPGSFLMASDAREGEKVTNGDNFTVSTTADTMEDAERVFKALSKGGKVTMPLQKTFWSKGFGMLVDRFGVKWMIDVKGEVPPPSAEGAKTANGEGKKKKADTPKKAEPASKRAKRG